MTEKASMLRCAAATVLSLICALARAQEATSGEPDGIDIGDTRPSETSATRTEIARALRAYAHEPRVEKVVQIALKTAAHDPQRARDLASRARNSGWVPTARLALRRGLGRDLSESQTFESDRTDLSTDDDLMFEASLTFDLHKLVFDRNEVAIAREERELENARTELVKTVIALYFERRRLQLERDLRRSVDPQKEIRITELEALLDAFTDGAFRRMMSKKSVVKNR